MNIIDMHIDTLMRLYWLKNMENSKETLLKNQGHVDLKRMYQSGYMAQFFAVFLDLKGKTVKDSPYEDALGMIALFKESVQAYDGYLGQAYDLESYKKVRADHRIAGILTIEEAGIIEGDMDKFEHLVEEGVRLMTLTWNYENCIGFPNYQWTHQQEGLKPFGKQLIGAMNQKGILIDVSHLSDGGFYDVANLSSKPFVASHSNARAVCNHPRNLSDDMIYRLADKGGLIGINFAGSFLREDGLSRIEAMVRHIQHIENKGGRSCICLGTDFDGIGGDLEIKGAQDMPLLWDALIKAGYGEDFADGVCYKNAERFLVDFWD